MSEQPSNATIEIFRTVRMMRDDGMHNSVKHRTTPFANMVMNVPGEEILVYENRQAVNASDAFRYGHAVTVNPRTRCTFATAVGGLTNLAMPIRLIGNPRDEFLTKLSGHNTDDLHAELRAISPLPRGIYQAV